MGHCLKLNLLIVRHSAPGSGKWVFCYQIDRIARRHENVSVTRKEQARISMRGESGRELRANKGDESQNAFEDLAIFRGSSADTLMIMQ